MKRVVILAAVATLAACGAKQEAPVPAETAKVADAGVPAAATPLALPTAALAGADAVAAQKARHDKFEAMGDAMKVISREAKAATPDMAKVAAAAATLATSSNELPSWFAPGTGPDAGKTEAKADIWAKPDDFLGKARAFQTQAVSFSTAVSGGADSFRAAIPALGKTCKDCHDSFRAEKKG